MTDSGDAANQQNGEGEVLLFESSPYGNLDAIVQHDNRVVYFYLGDSGRSQSDAATTPRFGMQACWVRNLIQGPYVINEDEMRSGLAPLLPRTHCRSPEPSPLPRAEDLKIVWLEEGNGAALIEQRSDSDPQILAVIPPWSGMEGFHGYAYECSAESPLCWPLPANPNLQHRIEQAEEFWASFSNTPDPFAKLQADLLSIYKRSFHAASNTAEKLEADRSGRQAGESNYWAIDGGQFPPRGLVHYRTDPGNILATVGMSLCPQPSVELFSESPSGDRRIEIAIQLPADFSSSRIDDVAKRISSLSAYPWQQFSWFGHGHTCDFSNLIPGCKHALFMHDRVRNPQRPLDLPTFRGDPINLLWLVPLDAEQQPLLQPDDFASK